MNWREKPPHDGLRVLVVDDNPDAADSLGVLLQFWGYAPRVAHDSSSAVEAWHGFRPHVVLMDLAMPRMDGYQLAQYVREQSSDPVLLVAVSGYADADHRARAERDFDAYLVKPVNLYALQALLAATAERLGLRSEPQPAGGGG